MVSILVIGPKDFPIMLKKIGSWIGSIKKYFNELQSEVSLYEHESDEKKENIYTNIDEMLGGTLKSEED